MHFEWDPDKSEAKVKDRGFHFEFASLIFDGPTLEVPDRRRYYGEMRVVAAGLAEDVALTVVYTDRHDAQGDIVRHIISARGSKPP